MNDHYRPNGMNIELTTRCPLRCPQCYCSLEGGKDIPLETAIKRLEEAAELGVQHVELSGGETMCYPHLYEIVAAASRLGIAPSIAVSGWHFDENVLDKLIAAGIDMIYVSLNGPTPEENQKTRDGYEYAINALRILCERKFENTVINWVMHKDSVPHLPQMIEIAQKYQVSGILIIEPKPTSTGELHTYPTPEQIRSVAQMVKNNKGPVDLIIQHCFSPLLALSCSNKLWGNMNRGPYKGCTAGLCSYCINVDGKFIPCRHLEIPESWDSSDKYWEESPTLNALRAMDENKKEPCLSCELSNYCRHCVTVNHSLYGELFIGNHNCHLF